MKKEELIRYRAGLAALLVSGSMFLGGCEQNKGFVFGIGEDNSYIAREDSIINNNCIDNCYLVEAYNKLTEETELFIAKKCDETKIIERPFGRDTEVTGQYYLDLMNNNNKLFYNDNNRNNFFVYIKETPLYDYMITLDLIKARYSYEDMEKILEEIKSVYKFESDKELVK